MMNNGKKKMSAEELLEIIVASESNLLELDLLEYVYYRQLNGIEGAPINDEEIRELSEESSKRMKIFLEHLPEECKKYYQDFEDAEERLEARLQYYSFKQGVKYYKELQKIIDN